MKKAIAVGIALAIGSVTPVYTRAKKRLYHPDAYAACAELAEYVGRKQQQEWERCLAKETRRITKLSPSASKQLIEPYRFPQ
jgi:hypothetical protein